MMYVRFVPYPYLIAMSTDPHSTIKVKADQLLRDDTSRYGHIMQMCTGGCCTMRRGCFMVGGGGCCTGGGRLVQWYYGKSQNIYGCRKFN